MTPCTHTSASPLLSVTFFVPQLIRNVVPHLLVSVFIAFLGHPKILALVPQVKKRVAQKVCVHSLTIAYITPAVMSLLLGQTIIRSTSAEGSTMTGPDIAVTFSLLAGATILFIGLVRLGILVDFIPGV